MIQTPERILDALLSRLPELLTMKTDLERAFDLLRQCYDQNGTVLCCGNGGSAADAEHIVGELMKSFLRHRPLPPETVQRFSGSPERRAMASALEAPLPAISLVSHAALISAYANDVDPEMVYAQQVLGYGSGRRALLIGLSTSGNSANVVNAVETANCLGLPSIGITGESGGKMAEYCTVCLRLPAKETYLVQEYTLPVYHTLCAMVEAQYFPDTI